ncbi:MAG: BLUF domain-containing protein [Phycisphaerales bacterium]|nr:BLUF domain-containing protein [Hyphomonadaceae bacterium]
MLQRLIYFSARGAGCEDITALVAESAARNRTRGITGMLIADDAYFLQVLEGPRPIVSRLFQTISRDPRHSDVVLVEAEEIRQQVYPDWGMTQLDDVAKIAGLWWRVSSERPFDLASMKCREIKDFLRLVSFEMIGARPAA